MVFAEFTGVCMNVTVHAKVAVAHWQAWEREVERLSAAIVKLNHLMLLLDTLNLSV